MHTFRCKTNFNVGQLFATPTIFQHNKIQFIYRYDPKTKQSETLLDDLYFANGIALSDNEDYLLVNDLARGRILKYHLKESKDSKRGRIEVLLKTPGLPDNLVAIGKDRLVYISPPILK